MQCIYSTSWNSLLLGMLLGMTTWEARISLVSQRNNIRFLLVTVLNRIIVNPKTNAGKRIGIQFGRKIGS
eukprot:scaffold710_cov171-Amphora_coffeaeformis.AAC.71